MLNSTNLNDRTYEELIAEAIAQIPLYSTEWTNYNPSDPGITILENLTAFHVLQQEELNEVTSDIKYQLLKMAGFEPRAGHSSQVLLQAESREEGAVMLPNQQVHFGDLSFEFLEESRIDRGRIQGVYTEFDGAVQDHNILLEAYQIPGGRAIFGENPQAGQKLYVVMDRLPDSLTQLIISIEVQQDFKRNQLYSAQDYPCAELAWSLLTPVGFVDLEVQDTTFHLLQSGALYMKMPEVRGLISEGFPYRGYLLRGTLVKAQYDVAPRIRAINGCLSEVTQRDTKSVMIPFLGANLIIVKNALTETGYLFVYVKEGNGDYYAYQEHNNTEVKGRYYRKKRLGYGQYELIFDLGNYGYKPVFGEENAIMLVCCTEEMMMHRQLGRVCGYDEQHLDLKPFHHILPETFAVMACRQDENGEERYAFFQPNMMQENDLYYTLDGEGGKAVIHDCGSYEEAVLSIAGCAVYQGERGNILHNNEGCAVVGSDRYGFRNPAAGYGGNDAEDIEAVRRRFVADMRSPASLVTKEDYEAALYHIPGLLIHKVRATTGGQRNTVRIVVKPYSREPFPKLSELDCRVISQYLDKRRLLATKIIISQPVYLPLHVSGVIYQKQHYNNVLLKIQEVLRHGLDYITTEKKFGALVSFHDIYHSIEMLDCVDSIYELSILPHSMQYVTQIGMNLQLQDNCLCYLDTVNLEINVK